VKEENPTNSTNPTIEVRFDDSPPTKKSNKRKIKTPSRRGK
jgi:hypothetical protein